MITHHLNEGNQGGYFADDYGRSLCRWSWDDKARIMKVQAGRIERPVDLSSFGIDRLSDDQLLERLIDIAKSTGEDIRGKPFGE